MSRNLFKDSFNFSKKELNGILVLAVLILLFLFLPVIYPFRSTHQEVDTAAFKQEIEAFEQSMVDERAYSYRDVKTNIGGVNIKPVYFPFDPNGLAPADWKKLGLSDKQIGVIKNYEAKGGRFYRKEDVQKMYVISSETYRQLAPYIHIKITQKNADFSKHPAKDALPIIDINLADSVQMQNIKGVGPAFASRIVRYRDRLGGFYSKNQLREVYGLDSLKFEQLSPQISLSASAIKKININKVEFDDLKRHPYLNYKQINAIIQYRKQHGNYQNINDLRKVALLNAEILRKLEPYLNF